ncbi:PadR family transcriptional regulator [Erysipelothrix rhusiopathiae]|uniref:PadR family transcriptional regulator n=1 Tax=Erysipelothrix rhusiopathiae TaxID=1648 RepID=UPI000210B763|nr:PadR family transcriptional regulator [Erysipelothrix rhusiopathiae]AGN24914.1 PadR family transcriptional regulator [Erysipelothrix rhusiopathiae SY1027]AMS10355.1 PadR family transcriptional regulator [Erysipelothrix rhusiopathiae]AOO67304.1 PadR family transcriptional regulator [Erysipelothrix rhusiopathiae]AWU42283.1 PadR family transcriptional regulator [Erysipelothrix rhusiopathiae]MCG4436045.1 PadR family transcriptional regulator [Erysipelothrix rhusiopathiae]
MNTQFKKGVLELCVLSLLSQKEYYGYELISKISETIKITEGTIYPLLKRLKDDGYVSTKLVESSQGPSRKYYELTNRGKTYTKERIDEWYVFTGHVNELLGGENHD